MLTQRQRALLERQASRWQSHLAEAAGYLESRGFEERTAHELRLGYVDEPLEWDSRTMGRLSIPYLTRAGVVDIRYRCLEPHDCNTEGCPKYLGEPGKSTRLYAVGSVFRSERGLSICEGELDTATLLQCGIPAVGIPGAQGWKARHTRTVEDGAPFVVFADGDQAGTDLAVKLSKELRDVRVVRLPPGEDVNSMYRAVGPDYFLEKFNGDGEE